jgi:hypothetical protein
MDQYIEEKTPKGFTLKIIVKKSSFLVFDHSGGTVYSDPEGLKVIHRIPIIAFLGMTFAIRNRKISDFTLFKVSKNKIVIPFFMAGERDIRYLLLDTAETTDMIPVRILLIPSIMGVVREADPNMRPDLFIVDRGVTSNDIVLVKNRVPGAKVVLADEVAKMSSTARDLPKEGVERAVDEVDNVNLNMMSQNPVFLARVHLRQVDLSKVKQLLLDFDMSVPDAGFIHTFILSMLSKADADDQLRPQKPRLEELADDFQFYVAVMNRNEEEVNVIIEGINDVKKISSYMTLIAKARSILEAQSDALLINEFENRILEKKDVLTGGS